MPPHPDTWLRVTPEGLHCLPGGFTVDPVRPVDRAVITHGHSDHARTGHGSVLATPQTLAIMALRMGEAGRARVRDLGLFTPARVAQDVENVYHRWLSERRGTAA